MPKQRFETKPSGHCWKDIGKSKVADLSPIFGNKAATDGTYGYKYGWNQGLAAWFFGPNLQPWNHTPHVLSCGSAVHPWGPLTSRSTTTARSAPRNVKKRCLGGMVCCSVWFAAGNGRNNNNNNNNDNNDWNSLRIHRQSSTSSCGLLFTSARLLRLLDSATHRAGSDEAEDGQCLEMFSAHKNSIQRKTMENI